MRKNWYLSFFVILILTGCTGDIENNAFAEDIKKVKEKSIEALTDLYFSIDYDKKNDDLWLIEFHSPKVELLDFKIILIPDFDYEKEQYLNAGYSEKMAFGIESHSGYKTLKAYNFAYVSDKKVDFEIYLSYTYDQKNFEGYIKI